MTGIEFIIYKYYGIIKIIQPAAHLVLYFPRTLSMDPVPEWLFPPCRGRVAHHIFRVQTFDLATAKEE